MDITTIIISLLTFLFATNVLAFALYAIDKRRAFYEQWRIPEYVLLGLAFIGGAYGAGMGMLLFRHKTRHLTFQIIIPMCFVLWMALLVILCVNCDYSSVNQTL